MSTFSYQTGPALGEAASLGLIVLQADETIEHDFRRLFNGPNHRLLVSRVPSGLEVTGDTLSEMQQTLPGAAALFPRSVNFDVIGYGCTSGTSVIGAEKVANLVRSATHTSHVTEPVSGLVHACRKASVSRLALLSPYIAPVSQALRDALAAQGIETPVFGSFDEAEEEKVARIDPRSTYEAALEIGRDDNADAVFLSCTNLQTLDILGPLQQELGKPVWSSNWVLAQHMAELTGCSLSRTRA
ncbi:MAG: aspartate/glutamate racemase family protein [Pseudomonadota bacterium]